MRIKQGLLSLSFLGLAILARAGVVTDGLWYPETSWLAKPSFASLNLIDATGEESGCVFRVPKTGSIHKVGIRFGTVTTADPMGIGLETVSAAGYPTGTEYGGSSSGTITIANVTSNAFRLTTLGVDASATAGDIIAYTVSFTSTVGSVNIAGPGTNVRNPGISYYVAFNGTPVWSRSSAQCILALEYSDGSYGYSDELAFPYGTTTNVAFSSTTNPNERGLKFQIPFAASVAGVSFYTSAAIGPSTVTFYDSDGTTILSQVNVDTNTVITGTGNQFYIDFPTAVAVLANTNYRIGLRAINTNNTSLNDLTVPTVNALDQMSAGQNFMLTTRQNAGAWTDTTTQRPEMFLRITNLSSGGGGGAFSYGSP